MKKLIGLVITAVVSFFAVTGCGMSSYISTELSENDIVQLSAPAVDEQSSASYKKYEYTAQDVQNLQDFILGKPTDTDLTDKHYDLNGDDCWGVFDLCLMRSEVIKENGSDSNTLVIYFSRTGNTEKIAEYLIELTSADSYVIEAAVPYTDADIKYQDDNCRANKEQNDKTVRLEIADPIDSIDSYDTIFLGYPIWWGQEPRIIDTFLESYDFSEKTVIPFCTSGSSGIATSEKNIADLVPIGKQLEGRRFPASAAKEDVNEWLDTLSLDDKQ